MTSMHFTQNDLHTFMNIIDDQQDKINEADYIKICNAIKFLHESTQEDYNTVYNIILDRIESCHRRLQQHYSTRLEINYEINVVNSIEKTNGRLLLIDKCNALSNILKKIPEYQSIEIKKTDDVIHYQKIIIDKEIKTEKEIHLLFYQEKSKRVARQKEQAKTTNLKLQSSLKKITTKIDKRNNILQKAHRIIQYIENNPSIATYILQKSPEHIDIIENL